MLTLRHLVSDIRNIADSGENTYSLRIEDEQIAFWIAEIRSMLISQAIQKRQSISDIWLQTLTCVEMIQVPASECCLVDTKCYVLRSNLQLPPTIESYGDNNIIKVVDASGNIISKSDPFTAKYNIYNKYTSKKSSWFLKNGYLYITSEQLLQYVSVYGLFEDPTDLADWKDCESNSCFNWDSKYPVSLKMANDITNIVFKTKVMPFFSTIPDTDNDNHNESGMLGNKNIQENKL